MSKNQDNPLILSLIQKLREKNAGFVATPGGAPPMDPMAMGGGGGMPMDPSMMGGGAPMPPMDPSMMGGGMPMDPSMMGGAPPMDPAMMGMPVMPPEAAAPAPEAVPVEEAPADPGTGEAVFSDEQLAQIQDVVTEALAASTAGKAEAPTDMQQQVEKLQAEVETLKDALTSAVGLMPSEPGPLAPGGEPPMPPMAEEMPAGLPMDALAGAPMEVAAADRLGKYAKVRAAVQNKLKKNRR